MQGKQHRQGNAFMSVAATTYLIANMNKSYWYLIIPPIAWYVADFPDIDQIQTVPKKWKLFKKIVSFFIKLFVVLNFAIILLCIYKLAFLSQALTNREMIGFGIAFANFVFYIIAWYYVHTDGGKFLVAHRGFTHTLVIPMILILVYMTVYNGIDIKANGDDATNYVMNVLKEILCAGIMGVVIGYIGHLFLDSLCKAGIPLLWPLSKSTISFGGAITSDKRAKDGTHISSKIYTYVVCAISIIITGVLIKLKLKL